jgi:hypothetical protein
MKKLQIFLEVSFVFIAATLLVSCGGGGEGGGEGGEGGGATTLATATGLLQSISISPATSSVSACSPLQYTATTYYTDGTTRNATNLATWTVSQGSDVALIDSTTGIVVGINPGSAVISALVVGIPAASGVLNVTGVLQSIALTPVSGTVPVNTARTFVATATCSNSATTDISKMATWASSSSAVASVSTAGTATGLTVGLAVITASASAVAASAVLNVQ